MDTIEISIILNNIDINTLQILRINICSLKSPFGYKFADVIEFSRAGNLVIKISYPRYFRGTNAYLIESKKQCLEVQKYFAENILEDSRWEKYISEIVLSRVDIPFTYYMNNSDKFSNYKNIFYIFAYVYERKKEKSKSKAYLDLIKNEFETIIYSSNGSSRKDCSNKLEIYNQYTNLKGKIDEDCFTEIIHNFPNLKNRIRFEVSKRINLRRKFDTNEFKSLDILNHYFDDYKKYILNNILDFSIIDKLYNEWAKEFAEKIIKEKVYKNFKYEVFILENIDVLYDYEILRRALKICIENLKTRENTITRIRKILNKHEIKNNFFILDVYKIIHKMKNDIEAYFLKE